MNPSHKRLSSLAIRSAAKNDLSRSVIVSPKNTYKVSIQEMVGSSKKSDKGFGVEGMETRRVIVPNLEKPSSFTIPKDNKPRSFIAAVQEKSKKVPPPNAYPA